MSESVTPVKAGSSAFEFFRATLNTAGLTIVRLLTGWARAKVTSLLLGTAGIGILAQANQILLLGTSFGSLGLVNGLINRLSFNYANNDDKKTKQLFSTIFTAQLIAIVVLMTIGIIGARPLAAYFFGSAENSNYFIITLLAIPFSVVSTNFIEAIFFARNRYDIYTKAGIWATLLGQLTVIVLTYYFGLTGAFFGILASSVLLFLFYILYLNKVETFKNVFSFGIEKSNFKDATSHGFVNLTYGALVPLASLVIRTFLIDDSGVSANGIYQVPIALTAYYTPFITNGLWARLYPKVSAVKDPKEVDGEITASVRQSILVVTTFVLLLLVYPEALVLISYSSDFLPSVEVMPFQFAGDLGYFVLFNVGVFALALNRLRVYFGFWFIYYAALILASYLLIPGFGVKGAALAYLICASAVGTFAMIWLVKSTGLETMRSIICCFVLGGILIAAQCSIFSLSTNIWLRLPIPGIWMIVIAAKFLGMSSIRRARDIIRKRLGR
ncbi:MAG: hypothetical protein KA831_00180 [Pyrinomonadaceae bacterium]|nr:hypothetical protein [Pyrinomonadaceae bacterium]